MELSKKLIISLLPLLLLSCSLFLLAGQLHQPVEVEKKAAQKVAFLSFSETDFDSVNLGDSISATVLLSTGNNAADYQDVVATDIIIDFPKDILDFKGVELPDISIRKFKSYLPVKSSSDCGFKLDYNNPDQTALDQANQAGRVEFSALVFDIASDCSTGQFVNPVSGTGLILATLHFQVKSGALPGASGKISFYFQDASTNDSNVVPCVCDINNTANCLCPAHAGETVVDVLSDASDIIAVSLLGPSPAPTQLIATNTPSPTPSPIATFTPPPQPAKISLKISLETRNYEGVSLARDGWIEVVGTGQSYTVSFDDQGNLNSFTLTNLTSGAYDLIIKIDGFLGKKLTNINLDSGGLTPIDLSADAFLAGDLNNSGKINSLDYNIIYMNYNTNNQTCDLDGSGKVNALDIDPVIKNWNQQM